jgi:ribonuclease D
LNSRVHFLERQFDFDRVMAAAAEQPWIGYDTEFIGEKTYVPVLCLMQIIVGHDIYLIDTLRINDLSSFLQILEDPDVLKITHAGDNDYRLLNMLYGTVPSNTFDTQIAAGFVGYNYPTGFARIVERELGVQLAKSHTVADWGARPLDPKAIDYAVEDVKYLPELHKKLTHKLQKAKRELWAREENRKWETASFYTLDPYKDVLANDYIYQLDLKGKAFLVRLHQWRREKAIELNIPRERVLESKHITSIVRGIKDGPNGLRANRTLNESVWRKYIDEWQNLWRAKPTQEETDFLDSLPQPVSEDPEHEWTMEQLYHLVKKQCMEHEISAALLFPRSDFNKLKDRNSTFDPTLLSGWRAELLGANLTAWLLKGGKMHIEWKDGACQLKL